MPIRDIWGGSRGVEKSTDRYKRRSSSTSSSSSSSEDQGTGSSTSCNTSSQCGSGYACIGGECIYTGSGSSSGGGSLSSCGKDSGGPCGGLGAIDCTSGNCGDGGISPGNGNCCGEETCCRKDGSGRLKCECGPCDPPPPSCSQYCTTAYNAFGRSLANCSSTFTCDECEECAFTGSSSPRECRPLDTNLGSTPCFCSDTPEPPEPCYKCNELGGWIKDCENCRITYTVEAACGCARVTATCSSSGCANQGDKGSCESQALANCYKQCDPDDPPDDPCAGTCNTVTTCDGQPVPACPPGSSCRTSGTITVGGRTCTLTEICDKNNVPEECKECDCHCNNDCPDCKICDASGECVDDPACFPNGQWCINTKTGLCGQEAAVSEACTSLEEGVPYGVEVRIHAGTKQCGDVGCTTQKLVTITYSDGSEQDRVVHGGCCNCVEFKEEPYITYKSG